MPPSPRVVFVLAIGIGALPAQHDGVTTPSSPATTVDFVRDVRPILTQHCFQCHGPDETKRKGELRLDRRADAFASRDGGAAFVAEDPSASLALARVVSTDPEERMPPPDAGDALSPAQIDVLQRWVAAGAPWPEHWAFVPPKQPIVPEVANAEWSRSAIDRFVLARLEREGLQPSQPAPRETWLRRVTFDLIGLPPTVQELDEFARDTAPDAFEKVVDRLLADKRYGERMATEWLDLARYADSSGYQRDVARTAWKWRDQVIEALNANQPFDRFTIDQLAGDLLPNPTLTQRIATGFNRNHPVNTEAGEELDEYRSAYVIDRVHTTATTWLGLTVACAQCHDHKYDPISQREFYSFYGFFNHVKEKDSAGFARNPKPAIPAPGPDDVPRLADLERRIKTLEARLEKDDPLADDAQEAWEKASLERIGEAIVWQTLEPTELMARHGSRLRRLDDGSILASGPVPARDTYDLVFSPGKRKIQALRLEVLPDPSMPHQASGRADDGRFILSRLEARLASVADSTDPPLILYALAAADVEQKRDEDAHYLTAIEPGSIAGSIAVGDGGNEDDFAGFRFGGGWSVAGEERKEPREAILVPLEALEANDTSILRLTLHQGSRGKFKSLLGRFRVSFTEDPRVRSQLLAVAPTTWRAIGPFPAADQAAAFATAFPVEKDLATAEWKKKYDQPILPKPDDGKGGKGAGKPKGGEAPGKPAAPPKSAPPTEPAAAPTETTTAKAKTGDEPAPEVATNAADPPKARAATKPAANEPVAEKPPAAPTADPEPADAAPKNDRSETTTKGEKSAEVADGKPPEKPKPRRLEWTEHREWRDGDSARLPIEGPAAAWYVARKLTTAEPRTVVFELDGGAGAKVWLNGNLVAEFAPAPEPPAQPKDKADAKKPPEKGGDEDDDEPDFAMFQRGMDREPRTFRLGLRAGENHLVVKLVAKGALPRPDRGGPAKDDGAMAMDAAFEKFGPRRGGGGLSFTFGMKPEGDDLLDYETLVALRHRSADRAATNPAASAAAGATPAEASTTTTAAAASPAVAEPPKPLTPAQRRDKAIRRFYRTRIDVAGRVLFDELERLKKEKERLEAKIPQALVMEELATPRPTHVFVRGDYRKKGDRVETGTPSMLPPMANDLPKNRLGLARWLVAADNPLTARVTVNRAWQQFFGLGLVRTADDFGIRGTPPSHPELLDWLALEFVASGWDVKKLHRTIVLSATYRQSSAVTAAALERDPENVLLARGPHQRLSAEMVRDQALFASGLLVDTIGGESVKPFQPAGLWKSVLGAGEWKMDKGDAVYRRGLYVYWKRGVPYPSFTAFDASKRETCTVTRPRTTTALQALVLLNDPVYVEAGRALGDRMQREGGADDDARLGFGFRVVASRHASAAELAVLRSLLADLRTHWAADGNPEKAKELLAVGAFRPKETRPAPTDAPADAKPAAKTAAKPEAKPNAKERARLAETAAWAQVGATLLNLEAAIRRG